MRIAAFVREVSRDLTSGTARVGLHAMIAVVVLSLIVLSELLTIAGFVRQAVEYRAAGAAVATLTLPGRIDGEACEALEGAPHVIASGAMRETPQTALTTLPSSPLKQYEVTPSFPRVLDSSDRGEGVYFSDEVADAVGHGAVAVEGRPVTTRGTYLYPSDGRRAGFGWAMLVPTRAGDGAFDECWIQVWPERSDSRRLLLTTVTAATSSTAGEQPQISQLNTSLGTEFTGVRNYADRWTRFATYIALAAGVLLGLTAVWIRRVEIAANLHAGSSRASMTLQQSIEVAAWSLPAALCGWAVGAVAGVVTAPTEFVALELRAAQIVAGFFVGSVLGALIATSAVRERRLWAYVKAR